jgi:thiamine-phosphate diphosphorylase
VTSGLVPPLHLVTDDSVLAAPDLEARAGAALEAGGARACFHLRGPRTGGRELWERGRMLLPLARASGARLLVNDRVDVARVLGADGAHLPESGLPVAAARRLLSRGALIGRSVHGPTPPGAGPDRPDYLLAGTVFPTPSHPGRGGAGPERIIEVRRAAPGIPVIAIGGIDPERVGEVMAAGAAGVAVVRAVWDAPEPGRAVERFLRALAGRMP